ncbi:MAG: type II toxin-antitoxin system RelE/ParE family toxin [bacterium]
MVHPPLIGYEITFSEKAKKFLNTLELTLKQKILLKIRLLISVNLPNDIKKLKQSKRDLYRLRVGIFRVIYSLEHKKVVVYYIVAIGPRKDIYKNLNKL